MQSHRKNSLLADQVVKCVHSIHDHAVADIDRIYDQIISDLRFQRNQIQQRLNGWREQQLNHKHADIITAKNEEQLSNICTIHDQLKLNINEILPNDFVDRKQSKISQLIYSLIKPHIRQSFSHKNSSNAILTETLCNIITATTSHDSNHIVSQLSSDDIIFVSDITLLYYDYNHNEWNNFGGNKGELKLYNTKSSDLRYLVFSAMKKIHSVQVIDVKECDAQKQDKHSVTWIASDLCLKGKHYPFCARFINNNAALFVEYISGTIDNEYINRELNIKKVSIWNDTNKKWVKVCKESSIKMCKPTNENMMIIIKDRSNKAIISKHNIPDKVTASLEYNPSELWCKWTTDKDLITEQPLTISIDFINKQIFNIFVHLFNTVSL